MEDSRPIKPGLEIFKSSLFVKEVFLMGPKGKRHEIVIGEVVLTRIMSYND